MFLGYTPDKYLLLYKSPILYNEKIKINNDTFLIFYRRWYIRVLINVTDYLLRLYKVFKDEYGMK